MMLNYDSNQDAFDKLFVRAGFCSGTMRRDSGPSRWEGGGMYDRMGSIIRIGVRL